MVETGSGSSHVILIVDDDASSRDIARRCLSVEHEVVAVDSGARALEVLGAQSVDLVLLDVMLPQVGGYEICRQVKGADRGAYLPVILLTALGEAEDRIEGLRAGADDFLTKPFNRHELRLRVNTFLRLREQDRTIRSQIDQLKRLQELKDDLVALVAHDLRNPLAGIEGHLELLRLQLAAPDYPAIATRVEKLHASAIALRGVIDGILEVRLLEEQQLPLHLEATPMATVLGDASATVEGAGLTKDVEVRLSVASDLVGAIDRRLATRAIGNLLSNAVRHAPRGTSVELRGTEAAGMVVLEVSDRGEGVPDALRTDLFDKFRSSGADGGGERRGYGLGLYLVKLVAEAHGGTVSVADRDGGGTTFTLTLPVHGA